MTAPKWKNLLGDIRDNVDKIEELINADITDVLAPFESEGLIDQTSRILDSLFWEVRDYNDARFSSAASHPSSSLGENDSERSDESS